MKSFQEFMGEESNFKQRDKVLSKHSDRLKKLAKQLHKGDVKGDVNEDKREEKARRSELAKKHGIDMTKPGARAKLTRLMKADTISKKRKESGDVRSDKEVRKDNVANRKAIDATRQQLGQSKAKKGTERRRQVDKKLDNFRKELRSSDKPAEAPPTREKVRVKVGTKVDKPAEGPKTGRNKPTAAKRADRKSYEAQQRRNAKNDVKESISISGNVNGNIYVNSQEQQHDVGESYTADVMWQGSLYRVEMRSNGGIPSKRDIGEELQADYPGAIVQNVYPSQKSNINIKGAKRYHPSKLDWVD